MDSAQQLQLDIKIIGAGIVGLACALALRRKGHSVTIYERNDQLYEFGAGIQLSPNATRIIYQWGLREDFTKVVNRAEVMTIRRYNTDETLGEVPLNPMSDWEFGYEQWQIYRPDLQDLLAKGALAAGVAIHFGSTVTAVDPVRGTLTLQGGRVVNGDVILGADGIRSRTRATISDIQPQAYKDSVFRAVVPRAKMLEDQATAKLMAGHSSMVWVAPGRAVLGYPVAGGELYNVLLNFERPSDADVDGWNHPADVEEVRELAKDFCSTVRKVWDLVDGCVVWTIGDVPPIETFVSDSGKFAIVGDAAHAIIPHAGQGKTPRGAMALEDAAALAEFLDPATLTDRSQLQARMHSFNDFRQPRIKNVRRLAYGNANFLTLQDGPEQEQRDRILGATTAKWKAAYEKLGQAAFASKAEPNPDAAIISSPEGRAYVFGYDVIAEAKGTVQGLSSV